jgi:hypothetical protein
MATYELSPSTLKSGIDTKWGCARCFYLKVKHSISPPESTGLGKLHHDIHEWIYSYLSRHWIDLLPKGKLIETELRVKSKPRNGVQLTGYLDGLIALEGGGYCIMDIKTTSRPEYARLNYALQVNCYAYCLQNAADGYPSYPVEQLGILTFTGFRFGVNPPSEGGIVGRLGYHEVTRDDRLVGEAIGKALMILSSGSLPLPTDGCQWCEFYEQLGVT